MPNRKRLSLWLFVPLCLLAGAAGYIFLGMLAAASLSEDAIGPAGFAGFISAIGGLIWHRLRQPAPILVSADSFGGTPLPSGNYDIGDDDFYAEAPATAARETSKVWQIVAIILVAGGAGVLITFISDKSGRSSSSSLKLEVSYEEVRSRNGLAQYGYLIKIKNVGYSRVKIVDINVNDRAECSKWNPIPFVDARSMPMNLAVGDLTFWATACSLVRATINTDVGSNTYEFSRSR